MFDIQNLLKTMSTAATLASGTLEGQLNEVVELIRIKQRDTSVANRNGTNIITAFNTNDLTNVRTVTLSYSVQDTIDPTDGSVDTTAVEVYDVSDVVQFKTFIWALSNLT